MGGEVGRRQLLKVLAGSGIVAAVPVSVRAAGSSRTTDGPGPSPTRQWALVVDLRKCEGCVSLGTAPACTEACNSAHFVPEGQEWIRVFEVDEPGGGASFLPRPCMQCENAPCVNVCPVGASYHTAEGIVLVDHERCIGCRLCMTACPYGARSFNWTQPENPPAATFSTYTPEFPVPHRVGTVEKCMLCAHEVRDGKLPACVSGCPMGALYLGDLVTDVATNGQEVVVLSRFLAENAAYRLKEELGTKPRVWYLPGHGEEFGRQPDDERDLLPALGWQEQESASGAG